MSTPAGQSGTGTGRSLSAAGCAPKVAFALFLFLIAGCERAEPPKAPEPQVDLNALKSGAERGDIKAQQALGHAYASGLGTSPNFKEAAKWLGQAAEKGDPAAQFGLAELYEAGQGVTQSYTNAVVWYQRAAEQGHSGAQYSLAVLYAFGRGVRVNDADAARWYLKAAEQGEPLAQFNIGQRFQAGRGVAKDPVEAYKWLTLAAKEVPDAAASRDELKGQITREQLAEAKRRIELFNASVKPLAKP
jgi:uncharacterized protein